MDWILEHFDKEWSVIMNTPVLLILYIAVGASITHLFYAKFLLPSKDELINLLREENKKLKSKNSDTQKPITKQEIRTFLESINPEILEMVDKGEKKIFMVIGGRKEAELAIISSRPDFNKYLSVEKTDYTHWEGESKILTWEYEIKKEYIIELEHRGQAEGYCLSPKDALKE
jgi:hypothetical protein